MARAELCRLRNRRLSRLVIRCAAAAVPTAFRRTRCRSSISPRRSPDPLSVATPTSSSSACPRASPLKQRPLGALAKALGAALARAREARRVHRQEGPDARVRDERRHAGRSASCSSASATRRSSPTPTSACSRRRARASRLGAAARASLGIAIPDGIAGAERAAAEGVVLGAYRFTKYLTGDRLPKTQPRDAASLVIDGKVGQRRPRRRRPRPADRRGRSASPATSSTSRRTSSTPTRSPTPPSRCARRAASKCRSSTRPALEKKGMKLLLAVGQGSVARAAPRPHDVQARRAEQAKKKLVFVGKGLTFDTGGICIKPAPRHGRDEGRHGRRGQRHRADGRRRRDEAQRRGPRHHRLRREHARRQRLPARRRLRLARRQDASRSSTPTPRAASSSPTRSPTARELKPDLMLDNATLTGACVVALGPTVSRLLREPRRAGRALQEAPPRPPARRCGTCRSSRTSAKA